MVFAFWKLEESDNFQKLIWGIELLKCINLGYNNIDYKWNTKFVDKNKNQEGIVYTWIKLIIRKN